MSSFKEFQKELDEFSGGFLNQKEQKALYEKLEVEALKRGMSVSEASYLMHQKYIELGLKEE